MGRKLLLGLLLLSPLVLYPFLRNTSADIPYVQSKANPLSEQAQLAVHCFAAMPGPMLPASFPWGPMSQLAADQSAELDALAASDPVKFLERCLARYEQNVQGYRCTFAKQEKVNGSLHDPELLRVDFREKPFSVYMKWLEGADLCFATLYVAGENDGCLLARSRIPPIGLRGPIFTRPLDAKDVKSTSRFGIDKFGMYQGAKDTLDNILIAQKEGTLHLEFKGIELVEKAGGRQCYTFVRTPYDPPYDAPGTDEKVNELTFYIDRANLLQVGSILVDVNGKFVAEYFFKDIEINPKFDEKQFTRKIL